MEKNSVYFILFLISVFVSACSQIALKKSANIEYDSKVKNILNPLVIGAYACFLGASLLTIFAYRGVELSLGPVLEATSYIYIVVLSRMFLNERITKRKILGNLIIIVGILVYTMGS